ncbi:homoserine kinase [Candidatus Endowatersipora endosymbiont of Watersipora subatra]|uniref:homoserine kinase n=1 Tax=Candidatus Endowatersipora endosymbiont of Watersipora subatra TaxID=3077946 RepID=UPI00312C9CEF
MAVYTKVEEETLAQFLKNYNLGKTHSIKGIVKGVENTNYLLKSDSGKFILTLYEKRVNEDDLPFFIGLMEHLSQNGFSCPTPIRNRKGMVLGKLEKKTAAIMSFVEGIEVKRPKEGHCYSAGQTMARLHLAAANFQMRRTNSFDLKRLELIMATRDQMSSVEESLQELIDDELKYLQKNWPKSIPSGVIHADMFKDNTLFLNGKISGVIDFYFACNDFLAYDVAIALNSWCFDNNFRFLPGLSNSFISGYNTIRPMTVQEIQSLPILVRGAALRFLLTRLRDWLDVQKDRLVVLHNPEAFISRLIFWRQSHLI